MANNNESQNDINSLIASFCRQHFRDLLQFLRDFDISQTEGKAAKQTLNMDFLLQAYDHRDEKIIKKEKNQSEEQYQQIVSDNHQKLLKENLELKAACKWHFDDIDEKQVLLAVYEYFKIVQSRNDVNEASTTLLYNINSRTKAKALFPIGNNPAENEIYKFEDNTTKTILVYFGVKIQENDKTLGKQKDAFARFIFDSSGGNFKKEGKPVNPTDPVFPPTVYDAIPEARFIEAFRLYACVRNWSEHNHNFLQKRDYAFLLYKFIIFTHIGLVYICRRLWDNESSKSNLKNNKHIAPDKFKSEESVSLKVEIEGNKKGDEISDCRWAIDDKEELINDVPQKKITFIRSIKRYQQFKIEYKYNGKPQQPVVGILNYYPWKPTLNILVKPPHDVSYTLEDIAGEDVDAEEYISRIVTKSIKTFLDKTANNADKDKCNEALKKLGEIEPNLKDLQDLLGKVDEDAVQRKKEIHDLIIPQLKGIDSKLDEIETGVYKTFEFLQNNWKGFWLIVSLVCFALLVFGIWNFWYDLLQSPITLSVIGLMGILLLFLALISIFKFQNPFSFLYRSSTTTKLSLVLKSTVIIAFLAGSISYGIRLLRDNYLKNYNFAEYNIEKNQKVVKLMESILESNPENDEDLRIPLIKYYIDYANDTEKAYLVASPMLTNIKKYPKGILSLIVALYSQGKDFWKVRDIMDIYGKTEERDSNVINRIQGIMDIWGQGQISNISKGFSLLKKSAENGDPEAQYYLGYAYSHEMTDWEKSIVTKEVNFSEFDLIKAVEYLSKAACSKLKAALELGILYSDLNVKDSAEFYLRKVESNSSGELYKESLYRLGLLYEGTDSGLQYMTKAAFLDYEPAILYKANKENDYKAAIELYSRPGGYQGYRYIIPIVFDYIGLGQKKKALEALQSGRPYGKFDMDFIRGMEAVINAHYELQRSIKDTDSVYKDKWATLAKRDSADAMRFMRMSADNGCLYAEMICIFKDAILGGTSDNQKNRLVEIGEEIPFAYVLLSYLAHKEERMMPLGLPYSDYFANQAIGRGNLAGRLMFVIPPYYEKFINQSISIKNTAYRRNAAYHINIRQRALRSSKNKRWDILYSYRAETAYEGGKDSLSSSSRNFWNVVSKANNVDLNEVYHKPYVLSEITDMELLNEFSDRIIDKRQDNPFIYN